MVVLDFSLTCIGSNPGDGSRELRLTTRVSCISLWECPADLKPLR